MRCNRASGRSPWRAETGSREDGGRHPGENTCSSVSAPSATCACPLLAGRHDAWIRCCTARFLPAARRVAHDDATARDALQESWIAVLRGIRGYQGGSPACAWVAVIVRHAAMRESRRQGRYVPLEPDPAEQAGGERPRATVAPGPRKECTVGAGERPEADAYGRELQRLLLEALGRLSPTDREIIRLRDVEERSAVEVASRLGISRTSVSSRLYRAHAALRRRLRARAAARPKTRRTPWSPRS